MSRIKEELFVTGEPDWYAAVRQAGNKHTGDFSVYVSDVRTYKGIVLACVCSLDSFVMEAFVRIHDELSVWFDIEPSGSPYDSLCVIYRMEDFSRYADEISYEIGASTPYEPAPVTSEHAEKLRVNAIFAARCPEFARPVN